MTRLQDLICGALQELDLHIFNETSLKCDESGGRRYRILTTPFLKLSCLWPKENEGRLEL